MKKVMFLIALALGSAVFLSSCLFLLSSTHKMNVDNTLPDESAVVQFVGFFEIKQWNGIDIRDDIYKKKSVWSNDKTVLTVPSGQNSFVFFVGFIVEGYNSSTTYKFDNIELQYVLEAEKKYTIATSIRSLGLFKGYEFYIELYDVTGKKELLKEWKLGQS
jgi:hypothetical protein